MGRDTASYSGKIFTYQTWSS